MISKESYSPSTHLTTEVWMARQRDQTWKCHFITFYITICILVRNKIPVMENCEPCSATCPSGWIGFGSKCFYFSEDVGNWTFSQSSCMALDSHLALFDSLEELVRKAISNGFVGFVEYVLPWDRELGAETRGRIPLRQMGFSQRTVLCTISWCYCLSPNLLQRSVLM